MKKKIIFLSMLCCLMAASMVFAQTPGLLISGKVSSATETLPGVSVKLKSSATGTSTDINGNYSIRIPGNTGTLVFSYIGFRSKEVQISGQTNLNVTLEAEATDMEEVLIVATSPSLKPRSRQQFPNLMPLNCKTQPIQTLFRHCRVN